jgi:hypothetical protein
MLFTVEMRGKREGGCHLLLFAHGPRAAEARWGTTAEARSGAEGKEATRLSARYSMIKILGRQKHAEFLRQLRLVDISLRLEQISGVQNTGF